MVLIMLIIIVITGFMGYYQLKNGKVNRRCLAIAFAISTFLILSLFVYSLINTLYLNFKERQGVFLIYSRLLIAEDSESIDEGLSEIIKHYDSFYSVDYSINHGGRILPGKYLYRVEYDLRGMELILNIATNKNLYVLKSTKAYLDRWLARPFVFSSRLPS